MVLADRQRHVLLDRDKLVASRLHAHMRVGASSRTGTVVRSDWYCCVMHGYLNHEIGTSSVGVMRLCDVTKSRQPHPSLQGCISPTSGGKGCLLFQPARATSPIRSLGCWCRVSVSAFVNKCGGRIIIYATQAAHWQMPTQRTSLGETHLFPTGLLRRTLGVYWIV
ncbi:hypothetical protein BKA93DRAFT_519226 [Sparassis latifolia]